MLLLLAMNGCQDHHVIHQLDFVKVLYDHDAIRTDKFPMENNKQEITRQVFYKLIVKEAKPN